MKICLLTTSYPRYPGDYAGVFVHDLASRIAGKGNEVTVIAPHEIGSPTRELMDEVQVNRFVYMRPSRWQKVAYSGGIPANLRRSWMAWLQLPLFSLSFLLKGLKACRNCDIIHTYWVFSGLIGLLLKLIYPRPIILTVQGSDLNLLSKHPLLKKVASFVVTRMDKIIAVSQALRETAVSLGAGEDDVLVIPNGVDVEAFPPGNEGREPGYRLLWVGRFSPEKGLDTLVEAMARVVKDCPQANLTLVGDGPMQDELKQMAASNGLDDHILFAGRVAHEEIPSYLRQADLFVLPSLNEGLPLVLVEAMSAGIPVIASQVGGIPDVVVAEGEGCNGRLVPAADPEALAEAILALFHHPEQARQMGVNGRARVENYFNWSTICDQTVSIYRSLV